MTFLDWMITVPWALMACGCGVGYVMIRQGNLLADRLEAVEAVLYSLQDELAEGKKEEEYDGLSVGSQAPAFVLATLQGVRTSLDQFRGKPVLLIFFSPTCPFCQRMAPDLARLPLDGAGGRPVPVVVASGDPDANRALIGEHGIRCPVLLDATNEVAALYRPNGTPAAYLIDEHGLIAAQRVDGPPALMALGNTPVGVRERVGQNGAGPRLGHAPKVAAGTGSGSTGDEAASTHEMRIPIPGIPQDGIGVGDLVKRVTDAFGIKACRGCERRRLLLNRWVIKGSRGKGSGGGQP
jgi:peroxiredoxin